MRMDLAARLTRALEALPGGLKGTLAAFLAALIVIGVHVTAKPRKIPERDELVYVGIAHDLTEIGVFTDAFFAAEPGSKAPGRFFAPAYPIVIHIVARLDPQLREALRCHAPAYEIGKERCGGSFRSLQAVQVVLGALGALCVFLIAWVLARSRAVAWLAMGLALATGEFGYFAWAVLAENVAFLGMYAFLLAAVVALDRASTPACAAAGAALALAALARPSYLYGALMVGAVLLALAAWRRWPSPRVTFVHAAAFAGAFVLVCLPWMARNWRTFGDPSITAGYGPFVLVFRLPFNAMTWSEWGASFVYWLPDFGDRLAKALFAPPSYERLVTKHPRSFAEEGLRLLNETTAAAGNRDKHLGLLLKEHLWGNLAKHIAVTIPISLRGLWAGQYLALAGAILLVPAGRLAQRNGRLAPLLALALVPLALAGLHGFVSINIPRYNVPVIALWSFTVAAIAVSVLERRADRPARTGS
jgi:uncharacterized protein (DUF983 family)